MSGIHGLKSGQSMSYVNSSAEFAEQGPKHEVRVRYDSEPSRGDNGKLVAGATTGRYTVTYPNGNTTFHEHGPHANTEGAARRGANPNAKTMVADRVHNQIQEHFYAKNGGFNDRRRSAY